MIEVQEKETWVLEAPFILNGVDTTQIGTALWVAEPADAVTLLPVELKVELTPVVGFRGDVVVTYTAKALNDVGEVNTHGVETYHIIDNVVIIPPTVEVPITSTLKV